jgi:hypothetical protein
VKATGSLVDLFHKKVEVNMRYYSFLQKRFIQKAIDTTFWNYDLTLYTAQKEENKCGDVADVVKNVVSIIRNLQSVGEENKQKINSIDNLVHQKALV